MAKRPVKVVEPEPEDYNFYLNNAQSQMVRVAWTEYKGRRGLDIREHYFSEETEEWTPTGKGLRIREALVPEFIEWLKGELEAVSVPEEEPEPAPRKRVRPIEPEEEQEEEEPEEQEEDPEPAPRRGRGRPRKEAVEEPARRGRRRV